MVQVLEITFLHLFHSTWGDFTIGQSPGPTNVTTLVFSYRINDPFPRLDASVISLDINTRTKIQFYAWGVFTVESFYSTKYTFIVVYDFMVLSTYLLLVHVKVSVNEMYLILPYFTINGWICKENFFYNSHFWFQWILNIILEL